MGARAGLKRYGKCRLHRDSIRGPSTPYRIAVPTELSEPTLLLQCLELIQQHVDNEEAKAWQLVWGQDYWQEYPVFESR